MWEMAEARVMQDLMTVVSGGRSVSWLGVDVHAGGVLSDTGADIIATQAAAVS